MCFNLFFLILKLLETTVVVSEELFSLLSCVDEVVPLIDPRLREEEDLVVSVSVF